VRWAVGFGLAATLGGVYASSITSLTGGHAHSPKDVAAELRQHAADACGRLQWKECLQDLDDADRIDPGGAGEVRLRDLRSAAQAGLGERR
jgi:hypothetical protein